MLQIQTTTPKELLTAILDLPCNEDLKKLYSEPGYTTLQQIEANNTQLRYPETLVADFNKFCDKNNLDDEKRSDFWNTVIRYWLFSKPDCISYDHCPPTGDPNYFGLCFNGLYCCLVLMRPDGTVGGHS